MTRLEKINLAIKKGIKYNDFTGDIIGVKGGVLKAMDNQGYICFGIWHKNKTYKLYGHQFAYFMIHNKTPKFIDHINRIKTDNRISNLRSVTRQVNSLNRDSKGYTFDIKTNKWVSQIMINGKNISLGRYETKEEASIVYKLKKELLINKLTNNKS
jgi:hypothetical protein